MTLHLTFLLRRKCCLENFIIEMENLWLMEIVLTINSNLKHFSQDANENWGDY